MAPVQQEHSGTGDNVAGDKVPEELKMPEVKDETPLDEEAYKEALERDIEAKKWAEKFSKSQDWKKLAGYITQNLPKQSPYLMDDIIQVKEQGGYVRGLLFPENLLLTLIQKGNEATDELLKSKPDAGE
jgi:hypothetical protein